MGARNQTLAWQHLQGRPDAKRLVQSETDIGAKNVWYDGMQWHDIGSGAQRVEGGVELSLTCRRHCCLLHLHFNLHQLFRIMTPLVNILDIIDKKKAGKLHITLPFGNAQLQI